ncbi:DUF4387 domain-containing protein [Cupriavidus necator]|uniref:DUF4387 domain-containing protein n=1 Tax=Cupriavidus necator TaxID=106590 RepID=UPI00339D58EF
MPKLEAVCRHIRSKNAGPFWITVDLFFHDRDGFERHAEAAALQPSALAQVFGVREDQVKCYRVPDLGVLKISYPRRDPQGGMIERDLHGGQQYVRLVDLELD